MSAQEVLTALNYSSPHPPSDTYFLSTLSVPLSHTHKNWRTYTHGSESLASCHTHFSFWGYQSAECKLSPPKTVTCRQRCLGPCGNLLSPGTRTSHYFHGKGQKLCHLTPKWSQVELPWDNDQRSVFCFASHMVSMDLRGTGRSLICPWAAFGSLCLPDAEAQIIGCGELHNEPGGL